MQLFGCSSQPVQFGAQTRFQGRPAMASAPAFPAATDQLELQGRPQAGAPEPKFGGKVGVAVTALAVAAVGAFGWGLYETEKGVEQEAHYCHEHPTAKKCQKDDNSNPHPGVHPGAF